MSGIRTIKYYTVTPTLDTNAYAAADQLGGLNTITDVGDSYKNVGLLQVSLLDKQKQNSPIDILFFRTTVAIASSDNAALNITDALLATNYVGHVSILSTDYVDLSANSVACKVFSGEGLRLEMDSNDLYCILRCGGAPTYAASDLVIKLAFKSG